jgi:DUF1365 family protein
MNSCVYRGLVRHRRYAPIEHAFTYGLFMMYLDLAELDQIFRGRWLWSVERSNFAAFWRSDYLGDPAMTLDESVRDLVEQRTDVRPTGPIRLLTHLRYFGYCFNPVSFYYCFDDDGERIETIVAEITNTPWKERHSYVLERNRSEGDGKRLRFRFRKSFHVSPFMDLDHDYDWRFAEPRKHLAVHMENFSRSERLFDATMTMRRRPITSGELARVLIRFPFMTGRVVAGIYWQALRLRMKRCPFFPHPKHRLEVEASSS